MTGSPFPPMQHNGWVDPGQNGYGQHMVQQPPPPPQQQQQQQQQPPQQQWQAPQQSWGGYAGGPGGGVQALPQPAQWYFGGGGSAAGFPSMADLAKNTTMGGSNSTVQDQEVKVLDPRGGLVQQCARYSTFEETPFPPSIKADLMKAGFPAPSQIQQYTWPLSMQNRDVIGVAATGSGKTLAFLLPAFAYMMERGVRAGDPTLLVLAPTRELAVQIEEESKKFGRGSGIHTTCCYGGAPKYDQLRDIRQGVHGIIGTPGRVNDFLEAGQIRLHQVGKLVLDEADRMLDMGFEPQIRKILAKVPTQRHTLFFTATWPASIRRLASEFLRDALQVQIGNRDELKGNQDITQMVKVCTSYNKSQILTQVLQQAGVADRNNSNSKAIVFCSTKRMCDQLANDLRRSNVPCAAIHGDKGQREREQALGDLKSAHIKLLVATDVAARGLDIKGITLVVNYDAPSNTEDYVHRIGRTGRAGQKGYAVALISDRDAHALRGIIQVMRRTNQEITPEVEQMAARAGPAPPSGRALRGGGKGGGKGGGGSFGGSSYGGDRRGRSRSRGDRRGRSRSRGRW